MRIPVVLLGGINLARAFGSARIPVVVMSSEPDEPALASRYCAESVLMSPLGDDAAALADVERVADRLARRFGTRVPLVCGNDDALRFAYVHADRLARSFRLEQVGRELGEILLDKSRFATLARILGLPVPRTLSWESDGDDALERFDRPVLIKPNVKFGWQDSPLLASLFAGAAKGAIFPDGAAARSHPGIAREHQNLTFQQYIDGGDGQLLCYDGVCDLKSRLLAGYTGRKIRTYPPEGGESSCIDLTHDPSLEGVAADVARRLGLRGIFNMDFKRDPRDGRDYLLEVNARHNFWLYPAAKNGLNLAEVLYEWMLDGTFPGARTHTTHVRWVDMKLDYRAFRSLARRGELDWRRWLASLSPPMVHSLFSWRDPYPWLASLMRRVVRKLGPAHAGIGASIAFRSRPER
jgi:predicted ATP-grasp superfamily ATP-dependent carboligase